MLFPILLSGDPPNRARRAKNEAHPHSIAQSEARMAGAEMEDCAAARSDEWQESERGEVFAELLEAL